MAAFVKDIWRSIERPLKQWNISSWQQRQKTLKQRNAFSRD